MSYSSNTKTNSGNKGAYDDSETKQPQPQQQPMGNQTPIPKTIFIDCNRKNAKSTENGMNPDSNHSWTCEFPPIEIKTGDEIKVSSAYLNSIGVGNIISWTKSGEDQDNKARWIFEYYAQNDAKNDKREGYNMIDGMGKFPFPVDNKPAKLYRYIESVNKSLVNRVNSAFDYSWRPDPYLDGRFLDMIVDVDCVYLDNSYAVSFILNIQSTDAQVKSQQCMLMRVQQYTNAIGDAPTLQEVQASELLGAGTCFTIESQLDAKSSLTPADRDTLNHGRYNYKFFCNGVFYNFNGTGRDYIMCEMPFNWEWADGIALGFESPLMTCRFKTTAGNPYIISSAVPSFVGFDDCRLCNFNRIQQLNYHDQYNLTTNNWYLQYGLTPNQTDQTAGNVSQITGGFEHEPHTMVDDVVNTIAIPRIKVDIFDHDYAFHIVYFDVLSLSNNGDDSIIDIKFTNFNGSTPNYTTVNDLYVANGNTWNFSFSIAKPDGTQEFATCYAGSYKFYSTSTDIGLSYLGTVNQFRFTGVLRDMHDTFNIGRTTNHNTTITNVFEQNYIVYNGFDYKTRIRLPQDAQSKLSSTYRNQMKGAPLTKKLPEFHIVKSPETDAVMNATNNDTSLLGGFIENTPTDYGLGTSLGVIYTKNADDVYVRSERRILGFPDSVNSDPANRAEALNVDTYAITHYNSYDLSIDENYSSPSDIATELTKQVHILENAKYNNGSNDGVVIDDTLGKGISQNRFLIPVYSSANSTNIESTNGYMLGHKDAGSYVLKKQMYKLPANRFDNSDFVDGEYEIYFRSKYTSINKPRLEDNVSTGDIPVANNQDFNVSGAYNGVPTAECFGKTTGDVIGYPIQYLDGQDAFISQFVGSSNITFGWDDTQSRFTIGYIGQPSVSTFDIQSGTGGDYAITQFYPSPKGKDNYNFMNSIERDGGINITNWKGQFIGLNNEIYTPASLRTQFNIDLKYTMDANYDENTNPHNINTDENGKTFRLEWFNDVVANNNKIGNNFWNKLGFSNDQINSEIVGSKIGTIDNNYIPLGTTQLELDSADAILSSDEPAENTPFYFTNGAFGKTDGTTDSNVEAKYEFSAIGSLQFNGHNIGYGMGSTAGRPISFRRNAPYDPTQPTATKFSEVSSTYNPDRQEFNAYTLKTDTSLLTASSLPIKTEYGYYYMMSNIVESDFFISNGYGSSENIIGILSKLNVGGDYIFQYQAPQTFYAKQDRILTKITTTIMTPKMTIPLALDPFSSVIYQITRYEPQPTKVNPFPLWYEQQQKWEQITKYIHAISQHINPPKKSKADRVKEIIGEIANSVLQPNDQQSVLTDRILTNYNNLGLSRFGNNRQQMRNYLLNNPDAQNFLDDLSLYSHATNNTNPQVSDAESVNENSLMNTMMNQQPTQPINHLGTNDPTDIQSLSQNIRDNIDNYGGISQAPISQLTGEDVMNQRQQRQIGQFINEIAQDNPAVRPVIPLSIAGINTRGLGIKFIDQFLQKDGTLPTTLDLERDDDLSVEARSEKSISEATAQSIKDESGYGGSSVRQSTVPPSYHTGTVPPSYASNPLDRIDEAEESDDETIVGN